MTILRNRTLWVVLLAVSAVVTWNIYVTTVRGDAQGRQGTDPMVLSGSDIGFRVEGHKGEAVVGRFVVRVNGKWRDVDAPFAPRVLTGR